MIKERTLYKKSTSHLLAEELGLHNYWNIGEAALAEHLEVSAAGDVDDGGLVVLGALGLSLGLLRYQRPQLVYIYNWAVLAVLQQVVASHSDLSEVTRVELVHPDTMVVLTTGVTATAGVASVLADTSVTGTDVSALLAVLRESGRLRT